MENFIQKIAVSISEIKKGGTDADTEKQLSNLWENVCRYKRASETIRVGYSHTKEISFTINQPNQAEIDFHLHFHQI